MRWIVPVLAAVLAGACGGPKVPAHSGYKSDKSEPWKKAKALAWNDKMEAKADDDLSYAEMRRAKWYVVNLPRPGQMEVRLEVTPGGETPTEDFDLAMEIMDEGYRVISKADSEDEDAGETTKNKTLFDLQPGRYYIHLYLEGRLDAADFALKLAYKPTGEVVVASDFPAQVAFLGPLPVVLATDDAPVGYHKTAPVVVQQTTKGHRPTGPKAPPIPVAPPTKALSGRIVGVAVQGGSTLVTIAVGTDAGAQNGMRAHVKGLGGTYELASCGPRTCKATVGATVDQIKAGGSTVTIGP